MLIDLGGGGEEPVSVAEAKTWCRIERDDEDALIGGLITAARETVERETRLILVKRGFRFSIDAVPANRRVAAPCRPLASVTAAVAYAADGTPLALSPTDAILERFNGRDAVCLTDAAAALAANGIEIDVTAGLETAAVPESLRQAILRIVGASYEVRAVVAAELQPGLIPPAARELIAPHREVRL